MHRTDYVSHHSFNTVIKNDVRVQRLITVTLNPEKIVNSDVKCKSLCSLFWNKTIKNIPLNVDLMGMIILNSGLIVSVVFTKTLFCTR
jgi:hypothetical protein